MKKLVRDRIPEIIEKKEGKSPDYYIAKSEEYEGRLYDKLGEETIEFINEPCAEELADILEVVGALAKFHGIGLEDIKIAKNKKFRERGGFNERLVLNMPEK